MVNSATLSSSSNRPGCGGSHWSVDLSDDYEEFTFSLPSRQQAKKWLNEWKKIQSF